MFFIPVAMNVRTEFTSLYMRQNFGIWIISILSRIILSVIATIAIGNPEALVTASESRKGGLMLILLNLFVILVSLLSVALFIISIVMMYKAYKGERFEIKQLLDFSNSIINKVDFLRNFFAPKK